MSIISSFSEPARSNHRTDGISLAALMGLQSIPADKADFIRGSQLRCVDRMMAVRTTVALVSVIFAVMLSYSHVSGWVLGGWTALAFLGRYPLLNLRQRNEKARYRGIGRWQILLHGGCSLMLGLIWSIPSIFFVSGSSPVELVAYWTLTSCLMAAVAIGFYSTPLSSVGFIIPVGTASLAMMAQQSDPLLTAIIATFSLLLIVTSLRQAHQFGEQLSTNNELAEKQQVVSLLLKEHDEHGADWLWQIDADGRLINPSPAFCRIMGASPADLNGQSLLDIMMPPPSESPRRDHARQSLMDHLANGVSFSDLSLPVLVQGEERWWQLSASPRLDEHGQFLGFRGVGSDITVQKEATERIGQLARQDMLTNLPNRLCLTEELTTAIDQFDRWQHPCAVMMIDLDRFKAVNDTLGHQIGDELLVQVAARLRAVCSANETVGRLGGDEFAVVLHEADDPARIDNVAMSIIEQVSMPFTVEGHSLHIGASIGSATAPRDGRSVSTLMRCADLAMYRSKESGGGRHTAFEASMQADIEERKMMESALRYALSNNQLHLAYQPVIDVRSGLITGFEALARWTHPVFGQVPPTQFIPLAEEARLIVPIGEWVLRNACQEAARWPDDIGVSVNISPEQLRDPALLETVLSALAHSGLPAGRLTLEVTEAVFSRDRSMAIPVLDKLLALGVDLSLDDFGTGRSAIGFFSRTHFAALKIDRAFVAGAARGQRESMAIVRAAIAMSEALDIDVIAEGVETIAEYDRMCALGFTKVQGFHLGRPMSACDVTDLLDQRTSAVA